MNGYRRTSCKFCKCTRCSMPIQLKSRIADSFTEVVTPLATHRTSRASCMVLCNDSIPDCETTFFSACSQLYNGPGPFMPQDEGHARRPRSLESAVDDLQIGATHSAGIYPAKNFAVFKIRNRNIHDRERTEIR